MFMTMENTTVKAVSLLYNHTHYILIAMIGHSKFYFHLLKGDNRPLREVEKDLKAAIEIIKDEPPFTHSSAIAREIGSLTGWNWSIRY